MTISNTVLRYYDNGDISYLSCVVNNCRQFDIEFTEFINWMLSTNVDMDSFSSKFCDWDSFIHTLIDIGFDLNDYVSEYVNAHFTEESIWEYTY